MKALGAVAAIIFILGLALVTVVEAQDWGFNQIIDWEIPPPDVYPGYFSPSYSQSDSLLYFDTFYRFMPDQGALIYISRLDSVNQNDEFFWSNPEALPPPINLQDSRNVMPSINHTGDSLFFCSDRSGTYGGLDIWLSVKSNGNWNNPINLGDSVNSAADEYSPHYSSNLQRLFFDRSDTWDQTNIYSCNFLHGNLWSTAIQLPEIINIPNNYNYGPCFDDVGQYLYYTSADFMFDPDPLLRASYLNGSWTTPIPLDSNVNGFTNPAPPCSMITVEHASIGQDHQLLFYNRHLWDVFACIDFYSYLFFSIYQPVNIENDDVPIPLHFNFTIYPNPSNDRFNFLVENDRQECLIKIYSIEGKFIKSLNCRSNRAVWECDDISGKFVSSGIYFAEIRSYEKSLIKKLTLLK